MEQDEMQATNKAEITNRYRSLLTDFWKTDSRFSAQTSATEEKKKSDTNSVKNEYDSTDQSLLHKKNSDLDRIHTEESSIKNSAEEKRNQISESAKTTKDALNEIAFSHFVNLSDDRNIQIESDIDLVRALDGLVSKTQRSANNIKNEIEEYNKWKETHTQIVRGSIIAGVLVIIVIIFLGKREWDIYKTYKSGKELYQQKIYHGDFGAIKKFEYLKNNNSIIKGDGYYQEIAPLLQESYYIVAKSLMARGEWEKFNEFLNYLDYRTRTELLNESNYQRGVQAMKRKDWSIAISYFNGVDKNYKSTAKFLQECNRKLNRSELATNTTPPSTSSQTQPVVENYNTPQTTQGDFILQPDQEKGIDLWITSIYSSGGQDNDRLRVGGWGDKYCTLIRFDLEGLTLKASSAKIYLYTFGNAGYNDSNVAMYLERIVSTWNENTKWENKPSSEFLRILPVPSLNSWYAIDITDIYNGWQTGEFPNYGILLCPTNTNNYFNEFYSSDFMSDPSLRPKLVIKTQE